MEKWLRPHNEIIRWSIPFGPSKLQAFEQLPQSEDFV